MPKPSLPNTAPWFPARYKKADAAAIQAMKRGEATPDQQERAMNFILNDICGRFDMSYRPDSERDTAFAEGKRHVANQIVKLGNIPLSEIKDNG